MANIVLLYESPSLLISSMETLFTERHHFVNSCSLTMKNVSAIKEKVDAILIFVDEVLTENVEALVYIKDRAAENDIALFAAGSDIELALLTKSIPPEMILGTFSRPINVKSVVDTIDHYLVDENRLAKKKILVVDDSGAMLRSVKSWLEGKYQVVLANSGAMAIKYLSLDKPDLVLLDYEMPIIDGKQVLEMIRSEVDFSDVPVMFLTGKSDKQSVIEVMNLKPEGYILKTMTPGEITKAVDDFFVKEKMSKLGEM